MGGSIKKLKAHKTVFSKHGTGHGIVTPEMLDYFLGNFLIMIKKLCEVVGIIDSFIIYSRLVKAVPNSTSIELWY
jgi:hypothetical protein